MTSTFAGHSIADPNVTWLDPNASKIKKMDGSDDVAFQRFVEDQNRFLAAKYTQPVDISNNPAYKPYATVTVGGKVVATISNHGSVTTSNALGGKMHALLSGNDEGLTGPALAQARAEKIAALVGGKAEKMSTALTQTQFAAVPSVQPTVDYDALRQDPAYEKLQQTIQAHTAFLAQKMAGETEQTTVATPSVGMASTGTGTDGAGKAETTSDEEDDFDAREAFLDYMKKTPEERYFEALLAEEGLTKEEFDALPPDERLKIEIKIRQKMKERTDQKVAVGAEAMAAQQQQPMTPNAATNPTLAQNQTNGQMTAENEETKKLLGF